MSHAYSACRTALACLTVCTGLVGCSGALRFPDPPSAPRLSLIGNHEAIAGCVAEVAAQGRGAVMPEIRVDRRQRQTTVRRTVQPGNELRYELRFTQTGARDVQAEGRAAPGSAEGAAEFAFLWSQVSHCAVHLSSP